MTLRKFCPECGASCPFYVPDGSVFTMLLDPNGGPHALTCPDRVRFAQVVTRPAPREEVFLTGKAIR